jgi:hypothetical protein
MMRTEWAAARLALCADVPRYGSRGFDALPPEDPRRYLSAIRAAEAWADDFDAVPHALADELAGLRAFHAAQDEAEWRTHAAAVAGYSLTPALTLEERVTEARRPRHRERDSSLGATG